VGYLLSLGGAAGPLVAVVLIAYVTLIGVIAVTAVYSSRPARRRAALVVLQLLLPPRRPPRHLPGPRDRPGRRG